MTGSDGPKHVLVADDDEASRYLVESLLRGAGYEVRAVSDGEEALEAARSWPVDLLVTDILMPRMDGYRLVREWKADPALADAPVVFYTATYTDPADRRLAKDIGVDRFLTKPLKPQALLTEIRKLLSDGRPRAGTPKAGEAEVLREYSERLVCKLEDKVRELDEANVELRNAMSLLSEEIGVKDALVERLHADIEERERAQDALRAAVSALDAVIASSPLAMVGLDDDRCVTIWNAAAERLFGWSADEVLGRPNPAVPEEAMPEQLRLLDATRAGERVTGYETRRRTKDGGEVDVALFTSAIAGERGSGRDYIGIFEDISERRRVERLKSDFVSAVSHELRTPLTAILGYSDLMCSGERDHSKCGEMAARIRAKAVELDGLVERLLEAASIQAGATAISRVGTDVGRLLEDVVAATTPPDGIELALDVEPGLPGVRVDRDRLGRAIGELATNAFKYSPHGGRVTVTARREGDRLRIAVSDEGAGIAPGELPHVFERFTQADMSSTREFPGLGLGLYVASQVVEAHGGRISVQSEPGEGSTFVVELPLA